MQRPSDDRRQRILPPGLLQADMNASCSDLQSVRPMSTAASWGGQPLGVIWQEKGQTWPEDDSVVVAAAAARLPRFSSTCTVPA